MALTPKQARFVDLYFARGFNATQAAIDAGYSAKTARSIGSENLTKPDIRAAIDERFASLATDAEAMRRLLVRELVSILSASLVGVVEWDEELTTLVPSTELTAEQAAALKEVYASVSEIETERSTRTTRRSKVAMHDKTRAAELLARLHGLTKEHVEHSGSVGLTLEGLHRLAGENEAEA